ncbi:odorant receptor 46a-like [Solenopsis invicta]|uniref:odorant receptor 46a-like n=1 Tax=Solenopsis invicta TaxID=13686 RepID=UPI00193DD278|nr:odorant receptor 46a-like [Solenopsis invicta]
MEYPEERYYKLHRLLLTSVGLWPYQSKWSTYLIRTVITIISLLGIIVQMSSFFTVDNIDTDYISDLLPILLCTFGIVGHMYLRIMHIDKIRELFERISNDWKFQKTRYEIKVMHKHAEITRLFTFYYLLANLIIIVAYYIWMSVPEILDVISPMNESRLRIQPFKAKFFIDEERYFYFIRFLICALIFTILITSITYLVTSVAFVQHVCGMCELLGYRAERLFSVAEETAKSDLIRSKTYCGNIVVFIRLHYNIIKFIDLIEIIHTIPFFMDTLGLIFVTSIALMQILFIDDIERVYRFLYTSTMAMVILFSFNFLGQKITDANLNACEKLYNSMWYNANISEQKLLILILKRRFYPTVITACKFYVMSLQSFGKISQTILSYFMFMRQF